MKKIIFVLCVLSSGCSLPRERFYRCENAYELMEYYCFNNPLNSKSCLETLRLFGDECRELKRIWLQGNAQVDQ